METKKYNFLDALRGIAILMVLLAHIPIAGVPPIHPDIVSLGGSGVPLFFIISAYTLSLSQYKRDSNIFGKGFFFRRFFRIFPLYYIVLTFIWLLPFLLYYLANIKLTLIPLDFWHIFSHYTFLFGFTPSTIGSAGLGEWSLFCEIVFYCFFPFIYSYLGTSYKRCLKMLGVSLLINIIRWQIYNIFGVGLDAFFQSLPIDHITKVPIRIFFYLSPINHFIDFILGILLFQLHISYEKNTVKIMSVRKITFTFLILLVCSIVGGKLLLVMTGFRTHVIRLVTFFFLILGSFYSQRKGLLKFLGNNILLVYIGKISFSLYLLNGPIFNIVARMNLSPRISLGVALGLLFLLASVTYRIELLGITYGKKFFVQ